MTTWRMRIACWIPKATNTRSEYATTIAFPLQQWLHERTATLRRNTLPVFLCTQCLHSHVYRFLKNIFAPISIIISILAPIYH